MSDSSWNELTAVAHSSAAVSSNSPLRR